jgi:putative DNA primase/helicase
METNQTPSDSKETPTLEVESKKEMVWEVSNHILLSNHLITFKDSEQVFHYNGGCYTPNGEAKIKEISMQVLKKEATTHTINEIINTTKIRSFVDRNEIENSPFLLCVENGILNMLTGEFMDHTPNRIFFSKLPVTYEPNTTCPRIRKFLEEVLYEDDIKVIQELLGYCLFPRYNIHKSFMFVGDGANGKTTLLGLVEKFLGKINISNVSLQDLDGNRFAAANLHGKLANIYDDLTYNDLVETSKFKILTGESPIMADIKYRSPFTFINHAKLIFSTNKIPKVKFDDSDAFFRRWLILVFPNTFMGKDADPDLLNKLTTKEELSGLLNFALNGLERLLSQGMFSKSVSTEETRKQYIRMSDSVGAFCMDMIVTDSENDIPKKTLYSIYCEYCRENKLPAVSESTFHRKIHKYVRVVDNRPEIDGKQVRCWRGINWKDPSKIDNCQNKDLHPGSQTKIDTIEEKE